MTMIREKHRHQCSPPPAWQFRKGSVWLCDDCGRFWIKRLGDRLTFGFQTGHWLRIRNPLRVWKLRREAVAAR